MSQTMVGARAKVRVDGNIVGIFDSCQYGANLGTEGIFTLGRFSANEIAITSFELVNVNCSGFRIVDQGVHVLPAAPKLQDLLLFENIQLEVEDRKTGKNIAIVKECVPKSWNEGQQAKGTTKFSIVYEGIVLSDESGDQTESGGATTFP